MKAKHQRLVLAVVALVALIGAGLLAASALKDEAAYFYAPYDVKTKGVEPGKAIRLGGMVVKGSLKRASDGVTIRFNVTDGKSTVPASFKGITPTFSAKDPASSLKERSMPPALSRRQTCWPSMTNVTCLVSWKA